jgi:hypothetical protein
VKQIEHNNAGFELRLEYPSDWHSDRISGVNIEILDTSGAVILDEDTCTLFSEVGLILEEDGEIGDDYIVIEAAGTGDTPPTFKSADRVRIADSDIGPFEDVEVLGHNPTTGRVTLTRDLRANHSAGTSIYGLWCTYRLDTTAVDTGGAELFPLGKQLVVRWCPINSTGYDDDMPLGERAEISKGKFYIADFERRFAAIYPREHRIITEHYSMNSMLEEATYQFETEMLTRGLNINRVVDTRILVPSLMAKLRWICLLNGGDQYDAERKVAIEEYQRQVETLANAPIWQDLNEDGGKDDAEFDAPQWRFIERAL